MAAPDAQAAPCEKRTLIIVTCNPDTNLAYELGKIKEHLPEFSIMNRMPSILSHVRALAREADVFTYQELRMFTDKGGKVVDAVTPIVQTLHEMGFGCATAQYNPDPHSFWFLVAFRRSRFAVTGTRSHYLNSVVGNPTHRIGRTADEIKQENFGEMFERSVFTVDLYERETEQTHRVGVFHPGFSLAHRMETAKLLRKIALSSLVPCVFIGDYNSFKDAGGDEQIAATVADGLLVHCTKTIRNISGEEIDTTFVNWPYDFGANASKVPKMEELTACPRDEFVAKLSQLYADFNPGVGSKLDHCFCSPTYKPVDAWTTAYSDVAPQFKAEEIKKVVGEAFSRFQCPVLPSDHLPIIVKLQY